MAAGWNDVKKLAPAIKKFHAVHGCTVKPLPKEWVDMMDRVFGENGDPTVGIMMFKHVLGDWSVIDRLHLIHQPTLVINGRADVAQDFVCRPLFQNIGKVKWRTFELSSHTPMLEEREDYLKEVADFLIN